MKYNEPLIICTLISVFFEKDHLKYTSWFINDVNKSFIMLFLKLNIINPLNS